MFPVGSHPPSYFPPGYWPKTGRALSSGQIVGGRRKRRLGQLYRDLEQQAKLGRMRTAFRNAARETMAADDWRTDLATAHVTMSERTITNNAAAAYAVLLAEL